MGEELDAVDVQDLWVGERFSRKEQSRKGWEGCVSGVGAT